MQNNNRHLLGTGKFSVVSNHLHTPLAVTTAMPMPTEDGGVRFVSAGGMTTLEAEALKMAGVLAGRPRPVGEPFNADVLADQAVEFVEAVLDRCAKSESKFQVGQ